MKLAVNDYYLNYYTDKYLTWISPTRAQVFIEKHIEEDWIRNTL